MATCRPRGVTATTAGVLSGSSRLAAAFPGGLGGVAAAVLRAYGAMPDRFGRWKAPRGAGERDLLSICGGIGRFNDHQSIAATPHRSHVLWDMFVHRLPALVS
eukprot:COSAG05_NODE_5603_length_1132_cov_3.637948_2_plen_103_part_00